MKYENDTQAPTRFSTYCATSSGSPTKHT